MNDLMQWVLNIPTMTLNTRVINCAFDSSSSSVSGELSGGGFLLIGFRSDSYASIVAHSYWNNRPVLYAAINNGKWVSNFTRLATVNEISGIKYQIYTGDWNDMPTGVWEVSSDLSNSPNGNDGHYYRVFCKQNEFQQAYRIASNSTTSITYFRYKNSSKWLEWYSPYTPMHTTLNGITKIKSLSFGIYNLSSAEVQKLTDRPTELTGGRTIIITSGFSSQDEKVALILASSRSGGGGVYFGYIWGEIASEYIWKKIVSNP